MFEDNYFKLLSQVINHGEHVTGRNGSTRSIFGASIEFRDLEDGLMPLLTTRKMYYKGIFGELAAFIQGATRLLEFKNRGCNYWDENAAAWYRNKDKPQGHQEVGRIYGAQWRNFNGCDQLKRLLVGLKNNPTSRRHILSAYNPAELEQGCLPPCHLLAQYSVRRGGFLESCVYMRSVDLCVGLPTDVVLYAALQAIIAHELKLYPGAITFMLGDAHIYENHIPLLQTQLSREIAAPPLYSIEEDMQVLNFHQEDITIFNYTPQEAIKYEFNV